MSNSTASPSLSLELKTYVEDRDFGNPEPERRSQTAIYHLHDKNWWIKVTLKNSISFFSRNAKPGHVKSKRERRVEFQDFVTMINFKSLVQDFLDDSVTEIVFNEYPVSAGAAYLHIESEDIPYYIREDPSHVRYPSYLDFPSFEAIQVTDLIQEVEISNGVFRVLHNGNTPYILKVVNCPFYHPRDTEVIRKELENLELFRGVEGIVQPAGVAVFPNPYASSQQSSEQMVISGILMEYYNGGTLEWLLNEDCVTDSSWERWAVQIGNALDTMHRAEKTHMDLKPSNIVLDKNGNAVIIDISCIGGVTSEWQAPEILDEIAPLDLPFETREWHDNWAYGMILKEIASKVEDDSCMRNLSTIADHLTQDVSSRCTLSKALSQLKIRQCGD